METNSLRLSTIPILLIEKLTDFEIRVPHLKSKLTLKSCRNLKAMKVRQRFVFQTSY